jgi:hypothetical protein
LRSHLDTPAAVLSEKELPVRIGYEAQYAPGIAYPSFTQGRPSTLELVDFVSSGLVGWLVLVVPICADACYSFPGE